MVFSFSYVGIVQKQSADLKNKLVSSMLTSLNVLTLVIKSVGIET
jgi:hypothetical protein